MARGPSPKYLPEAQASEGFTCQSKGRNVFMDGRILIYADNIKNIYGEGMDAVFNQVVGYGAGTDAVIKRRWTCC